ncbi:MBL fold metallo-hydrolase [Nocardia asiatica]|uniref:MBL fold metallo-hydrolase n=1 Tax=Nocardia asiatica TaxID=209252 RepID=UPI002458AADA|nr:MBL fold metallo-hydrolase [Nocardia asiatica]
MRKPDLGPHLTVQRHLGGQSSGWPRRVNRATNPRKGLWPRQHSPVKPDRFGVGTYRSTRRSTLSRCAWTRVFTCGHNSSHTAGANSYLLRRRGGNLMVDTPRWSESLAARYETLGVVTDVLLTHRDHAAHGRRYADRFRARLWIHEGDLDSAPDADQIIRGTDPVEIVDGVMAHPFPGHTEGSVLCMVDDRYCFSGDSLYWSRTTGDIEIAETVTWYSVEVLAESLARSADRLRFEWLLPGHGDRRQLPADEMALRMRGLAVRVKALRPQPIDFGDIRW